MVLNVSHNAFLKIKKPAEKRASFFDAGVLGFEPRNVGSKGRCLTAWRHPNQNIQCCKITKADTPPHKRCCFLPFGSIVMFDCK